MKREESQEPFDIVVSVDADDTDGYEIVGTRQIEDGLYEVILAKNADAAHRYGASTKTRHANTATRAVDKATVVPTGARPPAIIGTRQVPSDSLSATVTDFAVARSGLDANDSSTVEKAPRRRSTSSTPRTSRSATSPSSAATTAKVGDTLDSASATPRARRSAPPSAPATPSVPAAKTAGAPVETKSAAPTPMNMVDVPVFEDLAEIVHINVATNAPTTAHDDAVVLEAPVLSVVSDVATSEATLNESFTAPTIEEVRGDVAPEAPVGAPAAVLAASSPSAPAPVELEPEPVVEVVKSTPGERITVPTKTPAHAKKPEPPVKAPAKSGAKATPVKKGFLSRFKGKADADNKSAVTGAIRPPSTAPRAHVEIDPKTARPVFDPSKPIVDARTRTNEDGEETKSSRRSKGANDFTGRNAVARPESEFLNSLVAAGLVTTNQLDEAHQRTLKTGRKIFEALDELDILDEERISQEVAKYYKLPICDLPHEEIDAAALDLVPEQIAREHMAFPIQISPEGLYVAVAEPSERLAGLLGQASGNNITMAIAKASDIRWAIDSNYHALMGVAELVEEFEMDDKPVRRTTIATTTTDAPADNAPIVQVVNRILSQAMRDGASDIHIEPADDIVRVRNRVDGVLKVVLVLPAAMGLGLVSRIKIMADMNIVERRRPQDGKFTALVDGREIDVRVATVATIWGETCVMRVLDKTRSVLGIDELGMPEDTHKAYSKLIRSPFGMVLCVGPTGSGKTTTLYASLTEISDVARNVMTIEDPVEYVFPSINQIQTNEQAGLTFATGLKSILRQDSDVVLVGEIRDVETAQIAVQSTLTGHFVLSSLHSTDAISALTRFIDMGIESFLIASSVIAIVGQRLVRRTCTSCKVPYTPSDEEMAFYTKGGGVKKDVFYHGAGCNFCSHTGFKDRIGVYELLQMTPELKRLIVGFATEDELRDLARKQGMRSIQDEAIALISRDMTTSAEVVRSIYSL